MNGFSQRSAGDHVLPRERIHTLIRLVALFVFIVTLPFGVRVLQPVNNIAVMLLGVNWFFESSFRYKLAQLKMRTGLAAFCCYYLIYLLGMSYTENMHAGWFTMEKKLSLIVFPMVMSSSVPIAPKQLYRLLSSFVLSCLVATVVCFVYACMMNLREGYNVGFIYDAIMNDSHPADKYEYFNYWYFTYKLFSKPLDMHPVYFAMYLVFSSCIAVKLWWSRAGGVKISVSALLLLNFITVLLLSSRTQLCCMVLAGSVFIIYQAREKGRTIYGVGLLTLIFAASLSYIMFNPVLRERLIDSNIPGQHFSANRFGEGGLSLRMHKWNYTFEAIGERPLPGHGTGDGQDALRRVYERNNFTLGLQNNFNPHNQYLQSLLDTGVLGLLAFLAILFLPVITGFRTKDRLLLILVILFSVSCITESMLESNKGIAFYACFCTLLMHASLPGIPEEKKI